MVSLAEDKEEGGGGAQIHKHDIEDKNTIDFT